MHDRQRPAATGKGTYDAAVRSVAAMTEEGIPVAVRMTAIRAHADFIRGHEALTRVPAAKASAQFHMYDDDARRPLQPEEESALFKHYVDVSRRILAGDPDAARLSDVGDTLVAITTKQKRQFQCGAGRWSRALTPNGDVYPCHRFAGMEAYRLGSVLDPDFTFRAYGLFEGNRMSGRHLRMDGSNNCARCYAHHVCGGGCAQIGAANTGRIGEMPTFYCQETRLRLRAAVRAIVSAVNDRNGAAEPPQRS
jgi:radical SAM protein with 4Fe4S-binding SPASM domain